MKGKIINKAICVCISSMMLFASFPMFENVIAVDNDSAILEQQLNMPIVSINTPNSINSKDTYVDATAAVYDETGKTDVLETAISIRLRGNSTLNAAKKSYKMKFETKQNPLNIGDAAGKPWNLVANYYDTSLLRNQTAYKMGNMLDGMSYTPNCRSVEVYLNGTY